MNIGTALSVCILLSSTSAYASDRCTELASLLTDQSIASLSSDQSDEEFSNSLDILGEKSEHEKTSRTDIGASATGYGSGSYTQANRDDDLKELLRIRAQAGASAARKRVDLIEKLHKVPVEWQFVLDHVCSPARQGQWALSGKAYGNGSEIDLTLVYDRGFDQDGKVFSISPPGNLLCTAESGPSVLDAAHQAPLLVKPNGVVNIRCVGEQANLGGRIVISASPPLYESFEVQPQPRLRVAIKELHFDLCAWGEELSSQDSAFRFCRNGNRYPDRLNFKFGLPQPGESPCIIKDISRHPDLALNEELVPGKSYLFYPGANHPITSGGKTFSNGRFFDPHVRAVGPHALEVCGYAESDYRLYDYKSATIVGEVRTKE